MRVWAAHYELESLHLPGALAKSVFRPGALLRVEFPDQSVGYADLHPWTELGDEPLPDQLKSLASGHPFSLASVALEHARRDSIFRSQGRSAWSAPITIENHFLLTDLDSDLKFQLSTLDQAVENGFRVFKFKMGRDLARELGCLETLCSHLPSATKFRLDFNGTATLESIAILWKNLSTTLKPRIDFLEDPVKWSIDSWKQLLSSNSGLSLAVDRDVSSALRDLQEFDVEEIPFQTLIVKPALLDWLAPTRWASQRQRELCFTSYLDHPLGQAAALYASTEAQTDGRQIGVCGLASHLAYRPHAFSAALQMNGNRLQAPEGTGFGFDDLLRTQTWTELK